MLASQQYCSLVLYLTCTMPRTTQQSVLVLLVGLQVHYTYTKEQMEEIKQKTAHVARNPSKWPSLAQLKSLGQRGKC